MEVVECKARMLILLLDYKYYYLIIETLFDLGIRKSDLVISYIGAFDPVDAFTNGT